MDNLYVYIKNSQIDNIIKYGIKLSEYANKVISYSNTKKSGITAYLVPKDCECYYDNEYTCLRIKLKNINGVVYNKICEKLNNFEEFVCDISSYKYGTYEDPVAIITSTILPENIAIYNKAIDIPILIENSKDFYYENSINELLATNKFSNYELYQILLILGEQKKMFTTSSQDNIKLYKDVINNKSYTKKSNF